MLVKPKNQTIECGGCHMKSMALGDTRGWKPVALPGGTQIWFCDKSPCQQQHDQILAGAAIGRAPVMNDVGMLTPVVTPEAEALRQRVIELELENERLRQSTAPRPIESAAASVPAHVAEQHGQQAIADVHVDDGSGHALCGEKSPELLKTPEGMAFDDRPCDACVSAWTARREGVVHDAVPVAKSAAEVLSAPPPAPDAPVVLMPPEPSRPAIADYSKLPQFTPDLIARINDGAGCAEPILMTPSAYPDMDLSKIAPSKLKGGVAAFFKNKRVAWIDRAEVGGKFVGIVFQLEENS